MIRDLEGKSAGAHAADARGAPRLEYVGRSPRGGSVACRLVSVGRPARAAAACRAVLLCLSALAAGCGEESSTEQPAATLAAATLGEIRPVYRHGPIFLAGQPRSPSDLEEARKVGVRTVVDIRTRPEMWFDESKAVQALGMTYHNIEVGAAASLTDEKLAQIRRILREGDKPLLFHCRSANRVGAVWIARRVLDDGLDYEDALLEAKRVGVRDPALVARVREYIRRHRP